MMFKAGWNGAYGDGSEAERSNSDGSQPFISIPKVPRRRKRRMTRYDIFSIVH
jgi:hypothetical protein